MHNSDEILTRQPGTPRQLRQWVADRLRTEILEGRIAPGEWLRQEKLAHQLGVSQTPVREALKQLAAGGGGRVFPLSGNPGALVFRGGCGKISTRGAEPKKGAPPVSRLGASPQVKLLNSPPASADAGRETPRDLAEYRDLNRQFHLLVIKASGRPSSSGHWKTLGGFPHHALGKYPYGGHGPFRAGTIPTPQNTKRSWRLWRRATQNGRRKQCRSISTRQPRRSWRRSGAADERPLILPPAIPVSVRNRQDQRRA